MGTSGKGALAEGTAGMKVSAQELACMLVAKARDVAIPRRMGGTVLQSGERRR